MKKRIRLFVSIAMLLSFTLEIPAAEFLILGPRALGMGGAHVAAVDDATAVYWNPAAIAAHEELRFSLPLGVRIVDHNDLADTLSDINDVLGDYSLNDPEIYGDADKVSQLLALLTELDEPGTSLMANANIGLAVCKGNGALSIIDLGYLGGWVTIDLVRTTKTPPSDPTSIANNQSRIGALGIESRELAVSYARQKGQFLIGANAKYIFARGYYKDISVANPDNAIDADLEETSDSAFSFDIGLLHSPPESKWRTGLVVRNITSPSFSYQDGDIELEPQARMGIAYEINETLVAACDLDITENECLTPGYDNRTLGAGIEKKVAAGKVALRGGLYKNIAESDAGVAFTGGLGFGSARFKFDIGAAISPGPDEIALCLAFTGIF